MPSSTALSFVLGWFLASRLILEAVGYIALLRFPGGKPPQPWPLPAAPAYLDMWIRWDSQWYLEIARRGYWLRPDGTPQPQVFFPLYPLLMRLLSPLFGGQEHLAGLFISNAALLGSLCLLLLLSREEGLSGEEGKKASLYLLLFPGAFYFSALYTESLFLFLSLLALLLARKGRPWLSALSGAGATLTRSPGLLLLLPLLLALKERRWRSLVPFLLLPLALGAYMLFLYRTTGDPLAFARAEALWGRRPAAPWVSLGKAAQNVWEEPPSAPSLPRCYMNAWRPSYRRLYSAIDLGAFLSSFFLLLLGIRRLPPYLTLWHLLLLVPPLLAPALRSMTPIPSMVRYVTVAFPGFLALASFRLSPHLETGLGAFFFALQALFFALFVTWNWIA